MLDIIFGASALVRLFGSVWLLLLLRLLLLLLLLVLLKGSIHYLKQFLSVYIAQLGVQACSLII